MKKVISLALSALLALSLAACGGSNTTTVVSSTESSGSSTEAAQTEAPESEETPAAKSEFQEQTIVDNEYCTVILKGTDDEDGMWGYSWKVYLENKTADKTRPLADPVLRLSVTAWCPTRRSIFTQGSPFGLIPCGIY